MHFLQDKFDRDKGQKSAISGRLLHWRLSTGIFCFFSSIYVQFSKTSPLKSGESSEKSSGENRVKSCHVCGCRGFFGPDFRPKTTNFGCPFCSFREVPFFASKWLKYAVFALQKAKTAGTKRGLRRLFLRILCFFPCEIRGEVREKEQHAQKYV